MFFNFIKAEDKVQGVILNSEKLISSDICGNTKYKQEYSFVEFIKIDNTAVSYSDKDITRQKNIENVSNWVKNTDSKPLFDDGYILENITTDCITPYLSEVIQTELYNVAKYTFKFTITYIEEAI